MIINTKRISWQIYVHNYSTSANPPHPFLIFPFFVSMSQLHLPKEGLLEPILPSVATVVTPLLFAQALKFSSKDNKD